MRRVFMLDVLQQQKHAFRKQLQFVIRATGRKSPAEIDLFSAFQIKNGRLGGAAMTTRFNEG
jgi:hypothetical protein